MDEYWRSALFAALETLPFVDVFYSPKEFFRFSRKFYPLDFSITRDSQSVGFCVRKDLLFQVDISLLELVNSERQLIYANDVFFVVCLTPPDQVYNHYGMEQHFSDFCQIRESVFSGALSRNSTPFWRVDRNSAEKKVLVVGASNMGNIGDDLLANAIGQKFLGKKVEWSIFYSDFRVAKLDLVDFDLIIVGGGGLIYSSQFGANDTDNLSNYLKFPIWAKQLNIPCILLGVGVQGRLRHLERDPLVLDFLRKALLSASDIVVRDSISKEELDRLTGLDVKQLPDLVFGMADDFIGRELSNNESLSKSVAFIGEIFSNRVAFFNHVLNANPAVFFELFSEVDLFFVVMSNDDLVHRDQFLSIAGAAGLSCDVFDARNKSISELMIFFAQMSGVVTTRFHGAILAIISSVPFVSIDLSFGKHSVLFRDYIPSARKSLIDETCDGLAVLEKINLLITNPDGFMLDFNDVENAVILARGYVDVIDNAVAS